MSDKKSKKYTISGISITNGEAYFGFNKQGSIDAVYEKLDNGNLKPLDPSSTDFEKATSSQEAVNAYNIAKFRGNKSSYISGVDDLEIASTEELNQNFTKADKKFRNRSFVSTGGVASIAQYASPTTGNREGGTYENMDARGFFKLKGRKETAMIHAYPLDIDTKQDHMKIKRYYYRRPDINQSRGVQSKKAGNEGKTFGLFAHDRVAGGSVKGSTPTGTIILPMPKATDVNGVEWGKSELTSTGLFAVGAAQKTLGALNRLSLGNVTGKERQDTLADINAKMKDGRAFADFAEAGGVAQGLAVQTIGKGVANFLGSDISTDELLARTSGRVLNPNAEMLFQGPVIRDFSFSFLMVARSQKEGDEIRRIIRMLKVGMAPKFQNSTFLENPDIFTIEYKNGEGEKDMLKTVNQFSPGGLALTTMNVDYAPTGYWSAYRDSQPVAVKMDLAFTELRPIYQSDHLDTPDDSVGF